jgi:hypothetical protein
MKWISNLIVFLVALIALQRYDAHYQDGQWGAQMIAITLKIPSYFKHCIIQSLDDA